MKSIYMVAILIAFAFTSLAGAQTTNTGMPTPAPPRVSYPRITRTDPKVDTKRIYPILGAYGVNNRFSQKSIHPRSRQ